MPHSVDLHYLRFAARHIPNLVIPFSQLLVRISSARPALCAIWRSATGQDQPKEEHEQKAKLRRHGKVRFGWRVQPVTATLCVVYRQGFSTSFLICQDGLVRASAFGLQELVTVFRDLLLVIDEAIHDASAARLDAGTEPSRILPTGLHALLVPQVHFQRVVTRIGDVVLVIEQTINY